MDDRMEILRAHERIDALERRIRGLAALVHELDALGARYPHDYPGVRSMIERYRRTTGETP